MFSGAPTFLSNATRIWGPVWSVVEAFSRAATVPWPDSPSPQPSPLGRGSLALRLPSLPQSAGLRMRDRRCSLSPRERAGVRGKGAIVRSYRVKTSFAPSNNIPIPSGIGHSCPQLLPKRNESRFCCPVRRRIMLRTGMSARRAIAQRCA